MLGIYARTFMIATYTAPREPEVRPRQGDARHGRPGWLAGVLRRLSRHAA